MEIYFEENLNFEKICMIIIMNQIVCICKDPYEWTYEMIIYRYLILVLAKF